MSEYIEQGYTEPNYIECDIVVTETINCDLTSLQTDFDEIDLSLLSIDEKINSLVTRVYDLTSLVGTIGAQLLDLYLHGARKSDLSSLSLNVDLSALATKTDLQNKTIDLSSLATKADIQNLSNDIENIILPSLNGNGSEYKDGTRVTVSGREVLYTVERSYHSLYSDNGYTVHYDLVSSDGYRVTVPEALLTKYVSTVV